MIISTVEFLARTKLDRGTLEVWIKEEWLVPSAAAPDYGFSEVDLARAQLIRDLMDDLGVNAEGVGIILSLVDQVHGLRNVLADMVDAARKEQN
jgi:chaperone modulatory protein CbpM